jgi:DNA-binding MarR family transcriptional regulator
VTPTDGGERVRAVAPPTTQSAGTDALLAARLRLVLGRLARHLRRQTGDDLSPSLVSALVTIEHHGPLTLGQIAAHEMVTPPSVTRMVGTLEARGLVRRETDAVDRRVARVSLTGEGRRALARARTRKTAYLARRLHKLDAGERAALEQALPVLERLLEDER